MNSINKIIKIYNKMNGISNISIIYNINKDDNEIRLFGEDFVKNNIEN